MHMCCEYLAIVLRCCEWIYEWLCECKHDGNGLCTFFYSDSTLTVMCFCVVVSKKTQISYLNCANVLGLYSDRFGVL